MFAVALLLNLLRDVRRRSYTSEQLEEIRRMAAERDAALGLPVRIAPPEKHRKWWKYSGLV